MPFRGCTQRNTKEMPSVNIQWSLRGWNKACAKPRLVSLRGLHVIEIFPPHFPFSNGVSP